MNRRILLFVLVVVSLVPSTAMADESESAGETRDATKIFLIGNSLTWDTVPSKLDGAVQWHVDCGRNLSYIFDNPDAPCVKTSTLWPAALKENQYEVVCVQPHYGTTLAQDVEVIGRWLKLQPHAVFVIHTGWARAETLREEYAATTADGQLQHSDVYFDKLSERLREEHPTREFRLTAATRLLNAIAQDVAEGRAPIQKIEELYRDKIHMTIAGGRYLMHNVMRTAIGQPISRVGFEKVPEALREYIDSKLENAGRVSSN